MADLWVARTALMLADCSDAQLAVEKVVPSADASDDLWVVWSAVETVAMWVDEMAGLSAACSAYRSDEWTVPSTAGLSAV